MELSEVIGVIRRWKWLVLPVVVLVTGYVIYSGLQSKTSYSAEATVVSGFSQIAEGGNNSINVVQSGERVGLTYAELVTTQPVLQSALNKAGLDWDPGTLGGMITVTPVKSTSVLRIGVTDTDSDQAVLLANSVANAFVDYVKDTAKNGNAASVAAVTDGLNSVEAKLAAAKASPAPDQGKINALLDRRDEILKQYQGLLDQSIQSGDIMVANPADVAQAGGIRLGERIAIGFTISLVAGIVLAFIAEGVRKALRAPKA